MEELNEKFRTSRNLYGTTESRPSMMGKFYTMVYHFAWLAVPMWANRP